MPRVRAMLPRRSTLIHTPDLDDARAATAAYSTDTAKSAMSLICGGGG